MGVSSVLPLVHNAALCTAVQLAQQNEQMLLIISLDSYKQIYNKCSLQ